MRLLIELVFIRLAKPEIIWRNYGVDSRQNRSKIIKDGHNISPYLIGRIAVERFE